MHTFLASLQSPPASIKMPPTNNNSITSTSKKLFTAATSLAAAAVVIRSAINALPHELQDYILPPLRYRLSSSFTVIIQEFDGLAPNTLYQSSMTYLAIKVPPSVTRLSVNKQRKQNRIDVSVEEGEQIIDVFNGIQFTWQPESANLENRSLKLSFHYKHKDAALCSYLPYILEQAKAISEAEKTLKLHMNDHHRWRPINLHHPATFDTMAMEPELKREVMEDLARFASRRDHYRRIGKAWKRGYLLYGPPGTGKSSLVAAMANYLKFDIYDLELNEVTKNSWLRRLLLGIANRSILVVEDIDCSLEIGNSGNQDDNVTLSGLLNFMDGLWSSCGEERIIVLTTNYKEQIDPALLRPGRMDMHVHMGYCTPGAFRVLAANYHSVDDHPLFGEIDELLKEVKVSPAQVAEELLKSGEADVAFGELIDFLKVKKANGSEAETSVGISVMDTGTTTSSSPQQFRGRRQRNGAAPPSRIHHRVVYSNNMNRFIANQQSFRGRGGHRGRVVVTRMNWQGW